MTDSEIKTGFVVVVMFRQKLQEVKFCSTFYEAVEVAEKLAEPIGVIIESPQILRKLLITNKACFAYERSIHIGEL